MNRRLFLGQVLGGGAAALLPALLARAAGEGRVTVLLSAEAGSYREMALATEAVLSEIGVERSAVQALVLPQNPGALRAARVLVTVGTLALQVALEAGGEGTIVATLIPREAYLRLTATAGGRNHTAVFIDQPVSRQFAALAVALPERRRIGVILGPDLQRQLPELRAAAQRRNLSLVAGIAADERDVFAALERILPDIEVLLATPDPRVFNAGTLPNLLIATYRRQIPLVGFSPAYLRAGALLSLQSSPGQIAATAAEAFRAALGGRPLPPPRYSRDFSLTVNRHVARSLGLTLDGDDDLTARLRAAESQS